MLSRLNKINFLIAKRQRRGLVILIFLLFIGMVLEVFGLGILIPALSIILDPEMIEKTPVLLNIRNYFSTFSDNSFTYLFLTSIVVVYFLKSLFIIFLTYGQKELDFIEINDISQNVKKILMQDEIRGVINCCSGKPQTTLILVKKCLKDWDKQIKLKKGYLKFREFEPDHQYGSINKLNSIL